MTHAWPDGLPIQVETLDEQGAPRAFGWRGRNWTVERVVQRWMIDTDWWSERGRLRRFYVAVITREGLLCALFHDPEGGWRITRVYD
ncbi:MAG: hypothetical protein K1X39_08570 [Thermoflexales bacterium]|nr:hypothetical protein [Thermoflexales bacterium]